MKGQIIGVLTLLAVCQAAEAGEVAFSSTPEVTRVGRGARIEFAASAATDCAIAVLGRTGRVVRHLAAGVLDEKPPPPLKPGLAVGDRLNRRVVRVKRAYQVEATCPPGL